MPYHRLQQKYAGEGLSLSRSVLCEGAHRCADLLAPIVEQMKRDVLAQDMLHTDDTTITIQKHNHAGRQTGRAWIYLDQEDRHVYEMTADRSRAGPEEVLKDYRGYIHADAYPGYNALFDSGGATEVACWAHVRRYFVEAQSSDPELSAEAVRRRASCTPSSPWPSGASWTRTPCARCARNSPRRCSPHCATGWP